MLSSDRIGAYLNRLGMPMVRHDVEGLSELQAAHLMSVPFHNLLPLANDGRPWCPGPLPEVVDAAIAGIGGGCDRTTVPFAALLQAVGFDARLAAATVRERGDHCVCVVQIGSRRFLCDVGAGHPYLRPWDLDGDVQEQSFHGWRFRFDPNAQGGPTLSRRLGDNGMRTVYVVDPVPCAYEDWVSIFQACYSNAGFGSIQSGLRAAYIQKDAVLTLREHEYSRDTRFGRTTRRFAGREAIRALLVERFSQSLLLVDEALAVVSKRRPELLGAEPRWFALGRGRIEESTRIERPRRGEVPDVLVSLATVGRNSLVRRLLNSLAEEVSASGYPGHVGVLIVENHFPDERAIEDDIPGLPIHRVPIAALRAALERASDVGVLPRPDSRLPVPIGAAREAQLAAIRAHLDMPVAGLPHPASHPTVVWMVDDDLAFMQLGEDGTIRRRTNLLFRVARYWATLPHRAVLLGTFTGDPPVPGLDALGGQLRDLTASVKRMLALGPDVTWPASPLPALTFDAYYDLSETAAAQNDAVWPYAPQGENRMVRDVALALFGDLSRLLDGQQITRPLVWDGEETAPRPSLRRGGNTVFLDIDALFRWPTPVLSCADGVTTRRADTIWAALAQTEQPEAVVEVTLPLLHGREGQQLDLTRPAVGNDGSAQAAAQVRGFVLSKAISEGRPVAEELAAREARVGRHRRALGQLVADLRVALLELSSWRDAEINAALDQGLGILNELDISVSNGVPLPGDPTEIDAFITRLPDAVRAWRGAW